MVTNSRRRGRRDPHKPRQQEELSMLLPDLPETDSLYLDRTDSKEVVLSVTADLWVGPPTHSFIHSFIQYLSSLNYVWALECKIRPCPCPHRDFSLGGNGNELRNQTKKCTTTCVLRPSEDRGAEQKIVCHQGIGLTCEDRENTGLRSEG